MTNNDVLRRIRYVFDLKDTKMINIFAQADLVVSREQISAWLKKDDDDAYISCSDTTLATFLNGFINEKRGKKEGEQARPENVLTNNLILLKLKIALNLQSDDLIALMDSAGLIVSKPELSAIFRKPGHKHYRVCKDQFLRNFLQGLQMRHRGDSNDETNDEFVWETP